MECHDLDLAPPNCLRGFLCPGARDAMPPQFCIPEPACYICRLSGQVCHQPQGRFEPTICGNGQYCPGGTEQIQCARGTFCPQGSYKPTPCSLGAYCPPGSARQVELLPLYLVIAFYATLAPAVLLLYTRQRRSTTRAPPAEVDVPLSTNGRFTLYDPFAPLLLPIRDRRIRRWGIMTDNDSPQSTLRASEDDTPIGTTESSPEQERFIKSLKKAIRNNTVGMSFSFRHLRYIKKGKAIINGITGSIPAGSFVGLMGGSGAGKSTFVNLMMGRLQPTTGAIGINNHYNMKAYRKLIGFVPQDDVLLPELTVRENILHSARVRLPSTWNPADIEEHVDALIACLGLTHVKESQVGDAENPVISGGQRKRVNIGLELAAAPMAIFADEPTSGLDSSTAGSIIDLLRKIGKIGITIVAVVHQPREQLFRSFDKSLLMKNGKIVYSGTTEGAQLWFDEQGYEFPDGENPADTLMDIITGNGEQYYLGNIPHSDIDLIDRWENRPFVNARRAQLTFATVLPAQRGARRLPQFLFCLRRAFLQQSRAAVFLAFEIATATLAGLLIGLATSGSQGHLFRGFYHQPFFPLSSAPDYTTAPQFALLNAIAIGFATAAPAVATFTTEKLVYRRESRAGHSISAYYLGKVVSSLPRLTLSSYHFTIGMVLPATPRAGFMWSFLTMTAYFWALHGLCSIVLSFASGRTAQYSGRCRAW